MIKKTVGLIVLSSTSDRGLVAVLQVRGNFNTEKNNKETYRGASQLTVHGSINNEESEIDALLRETIEELGEEFANLVQDKTLELKEINRVKNDKISVTNFGLRIAEQDLGKIKGANIKLISKDEISNIRELKAENRENGVADNEIAMFPDDIEAVRLAFEIFS